MHKIAVYDLDKTITYAPTWTRFLVTSASHETPWRLALLPVVALVGLGYVLGLRNRAQLKAAAQWLLLGPAVTPARMTRNAARFAEVVTARHVQPGALRQIAQDRADGYRIVMATASFHFYGVAIGERLGFDDVIGTRSLLRENGDFRALIDGENCYGANKLAMIQSWMAQQGIAREDAVVRFYTDHASDAPTLEWADVGVAVNPHPALRVLAAVKGWPVEDWSQPSSSPRT